MKIVVHGYYGFGNFGDDILCKVILEYFHKHFPGGELMVLSYAQNPDYVHELVNFEIRIIRSLKECDPDVFCIGGGGLFFDFESGRLTDFLLNRVISLFPGTYLKAMKWLNKAGRAEKNVAVGIGVGAFTSSSKKFRHKFLQLLEMDRIYVRDEASRMNLAKLGIPGAQVTTDLAFARECWLKMPSAPESAATELRRVLFILRDWRKDDSRYLNTVFKWIEAASERNIDCAVASLDREHDKQLARICDSWGAEFISWNPSAHSLEEFMANLAEFDVFVSSRAHGVLAGALLYKPVIAVELEDKLRQIRQMLDGSVSIISPSASEKEFLEMLMSSHKNYDAKIRDEEIQRNQLNIQHVLDDLKNFIMS